jgi:hypothetical protein
MKHLSEDKALLFLYEICYILYTIGYTIEFLPCRRKSTKKGMNNYVVKSIRRPDGQEIYNCMSDYPMKEIEEGSVFGKLKNVNKRGTLYTVEYENAGEYVHFEGKEKRDFERIAPVHIGINELNKYWNIQFEVVMNKTPNSEKRMPFTFKVKPINLNGENYFFDYSYGMYVHEMLMATNGGIMSNQMIVDPFAVPNEQEVNDYNSVYTGLSADYYYPTSQVEYSQMNCNPEMLTLL